MRIDIVGPAIIGDFLSIVGRDVEFPSKPTIVLKSSNTTVRVRPALVRPHWLLVPSVPEEVPRDENEVQVVSDDGWSSPTARAHFSDGAAETTRLLHAGRESAWPFTIAMVANPAIKTEQDDIVADSPTKNRPAFHDAVVAVLRQLLALEEDLLRRDGLETLLRFVVVCAEAAPPTLPNALCEEYPGHPIMLPRRRPARDFLRRRGVLADVVIVIHGSPTHFLATGPFTTDDRDGPGTTYTYDDQQRVHHHFPRIPGAVALPTDFDRRHPIVIHEFAHAASSTSDGKIIDAYADADPVGFVVNKQWRASAGDPIPDRFCCYNGVEFPSDDQRDSLGYPPEWRSYHPALQDPTRPSLIDDYTQTDEPHKCRLDRLTYQWLLDRLWAKALREEDTFAATAEEHNERPA